MKIQSLLLFIFFIINCNIAYPQKGNSKKPNADKSIEEIENNSAYGTLTDSELRYELSGKYEGIIEIPECCNSFDYKYGTVYIDVTKTSITFIYGGVIYDDNNYYYENKKIFSNYYAYSGNNLVGWFEKKNGNWVFWQRFDGTEDDYITDKKPDFISKTSNLKDCQSEINSYIDQEEAFKNYWSNFKNSILNNDVNSLSNLINFPLIDETWHREDVGLSKEINDADEFLKRIKLILEKVETTPDIYFIDQSYYKEMEANDYFGGMYSMSGMFNLAFDRINGQYKLVKFFGPAG